MGIICDCGKFIEYVEHTLSSQIQSQLQQQTVPHESPSMITQLIQSIMGSIHSIQLQYVDVFINKFMLHSELSIKKVKKLRISLAQRYSGTAVSSVSPFIDELIQSMIQLFNNDPPSNDHTDNHTTVQLIDIESHDYSVVSPLFNQCNKQLRKQIYDRIVIQIVSIYKHEIIELIDVVQKTQKSLQKLNLNKSTDQSIDSNIHIYAQLHIDINHLYQQIQQINQQFNDVVISDPQFESIYQQLVQLIN